MLWGRGGGWGERGRVDKTWERSQFTQSVTVINRNAKYSIITLIRWKFRWYVSIFIWKNGKGCFKMTW